MAQQLVEKVPFPCIKQEKHTSVAKATADFIGFVPGINPRPTAQMSFSAADESRRFCHLSVPPGELIPVPPIRPLLFPLNESSQARPDSADETRESLEKGPPICNGCAIYLSPVSSSSLLASYAVCASCWAFIRSSRSAASPRKARM